MKIKTLEHVERLGRTQLELVTRQFSSKVRKREEVEEEIVKKGIVKRKRKNRLKIQEYNHKKSNKYWQRQ